MTLTKQTENLIEQAMEAGRISAAVKRAEQGQSIIVRHPHTGEIFTMTVERVVENDGECAAIGTDPQGEPFALVYSAEDFA